jgi:hypothetical protein
MKDSEEQLEHLREDMDNLLNQLKSRPELKRRVLDKIHLAQPRTYWRKLIILTTTMLGFLILLGGTLQIPSVKAQILPTISTVVAWIQQVTHIPVQLPSSWQTNSNNLQDDTTKKVSNYYFEAFRTPDGYSINIYQIAVPVPFNDEAALLAKNGPLSESQRVGSMSGSKITDQMPSLEITIPSDAELFELIPGVTAYKRYQGTNIIWRQGNWGFEYIGPSGVPGSPNPIDNLRGFAAIWPNAFSPLADIGYIKITEKTTIITWDQEGIRYTLEIRGNNYKQAAQILDSLHAWKKASH